MCDVYSKAGNGVSKWIIIRAETTLASDLLYSTILTHAISLSQDQTQLSDGQITFMQHVGCLQSIFTFHLVLYINSKIKILKIKRLNTTFKNLPKYQYCYNNQRISNQIPRFLTLRQIFKRKLKYSHIKTHFKHFYFS